jgi:3-carboxymuconate cyclase
MEPKMLVFVGTYTRPIKFGTGFVLEGRGRGIYTLELDMKTGRLEERHVTQGVANPSYLVIDGRREHLYCVNELKEYDGDAQGAVSSFRVNGDGSLLFVDKKGTGGTDPCYVELDPQQKHLYVANFMSGSVCVLDTKDGTLANAQFIQHAGAGVNPVRQAGPHAHSVVFTPEGRRALVPDLGLDKLIIYDYDAATGRLKSAGRPFYKGRAGAGPRHCAFGASGKYSYLINELDSTIDALSYSEEDGGMTMLQSVSSLPPGADAKENSCADLHISPGGRFLYGSNRGHDSIIIYQIDGGTGLLSYSGCEPCGGRTPRNFAIDPTGRYLLCANQDSDSIVTFRIQPESGLLERASEVTVPTPVCVRPYLF